VTRYSAVLLLSAALATAACSGRSQTTRVVDITGINYAFQAPATLAPGPARVRFVNAGTVPHEVQFFVFKAGLSPDSVRALLNLEHFPDSLADSAGAVLIAAPHTTTPEQVYVDLLPGRVYGLVCQFRDSAKAQRHDRMGMFGVLQVDRR
jgi:plastocyanin